MKKARKNSRKSRKVFSFYFMQRLSMLVCSAQDPFLRSSSVCWIYLLVLLSPSSVVRPHKYLFKMFMANTFVHHPSNPLLFKWLSMNWLQGLLTNGLRKKKNPLKFSLCAFAAGLLYSLRESENFSNWMISSF